MFGPFAGVATMQTISEVFWRRAFDHDLVTEEADHLTFKVLIALEAVEM